jgi:oligoribonuclease
MLVWTDLETTGTDPETDVVLEVGAIVTDDELNEVARFHRVVYWEHAATVVELIAAHAGEIPAGIARHIGVDPFVVNMHDKNGLWKDVVYGQALATVDRDFAALIKAAQVTLPPLEGKTEPYVDKPQLAGSTISFDRGFIAKHMKRSLKELHYRNLDVSSFNETGRRFWKDLYAARPNNKDKAHRGMADIEESIRVYKHYLSNIYIYKSTDADGTHLLQPPQFGGPATKPTPANANQLSLPVEAAA